MSIHFHPLRIKEINKETDDCVSVVFEIPESLSNSFQFKQGQSLTMRTNLHGEEVRRTYSLCSSPLENKWKVAIKKVEGGLFSSFANENLKEGDMLDVMPPVGKFYTDLNPANKKNYLLLQPAVALLLLFPLSKQPYKQNRKHIYISVWKSQPLFYHFF